MRLEQVRVQVLPCLEHLRADVTRLPEVCARVHVGNVLLKVAVRAVDPTAHVARGPLVAVGRSGLGATARRPWKSTPVRHQFFSSSILRAVHVTRAVLRRTLLPTIKLRISFSGAMPKGALIFAWAR